MGVRLRVVAYNIHSSRDDLNALAAVVRGLNPDILIVQEGPRRFRWRTKAAALAHSFHLVYATGGQPSLGNVLMTNLKVRVRETWDVRFPLKPGRHMRGAAFARCEVGGVGFTVVGTHLSTDDEERPSQTDLARSTTGLRADVLKVAHHGSSKQDEALIDALGARLAVISVGVDNDYGHPAPSTLRLLARADLQVRRTDLDGDVAVVVDGAGRLRSASRMPRVRPAGQ